MGPEAVRTTHDLETHREENSIDPTGEGALEEKATHQHPDLGPSASRTERNTCYLSPACCYFSPSKQIKTQVDKTLEGPHGCKMTVRSGPAECLYSLQVNLWSTVDSSSSAVEVAFTSEAFL